MNNYLPLKRATMRLSDFIPAWTLTALLVLTGLLSVKSVQAGKECYFEDAPYTATISYSGQVVSLLPRVNSTQQLTTNKASTSKSARSNCRPGDSGEVLYGIAGSVPQVYSTFTDIGVAGLYATNVPGIFYSVQLNGNGGASKIDAYMPYFGGASEAVARNFDDMEDQMDWGQWYDYYITLYQTPQFKGVPRGVTSIQPATSGYIGGFRLGLEDIDNHAIKLNMSTFSFPVQTPTCASIYSSASVPLGDYNPGQIKSGSATVKDFTIYNYDCVNVTTFNTRMTTNVVAPGDSTLLGNSATSNAATGVGVKITSAYGGQLMPNNASSINSVTDLSLTDYKELQFSAQLVADKQTITPGRFSATGTFTINYE